jgi:hypothetical protein
MTPIQAYYQNAQLSMAAYANLSVGMSTTDYIQQLVVNAGFSLSSSAPRFSWTHHWGILSPF